MPTHWPAESLSEEEEIFLNTQVCSALDVTGGSQMARSSWCRTMSYHRKRQTRLSSWRVVERLRSILQETDILGFLLKQCMACGYGRDCLNIFDLQDLYCHHQICWTQKQRDDLLPDKSQIQDSIIMGSRSCRVAGSSRKLPHRHK